MYGVAFVITSDWDDQVLQLRIYMPGPAELH
jgi:hypothetical protein